LQHFEPHEVIPIPIPAGPQQNAGQTHQNGQRTRSKRIVWNPSSARKRFEMPVLDSFAPIRLAEFFFRPAAILLAGEWGQGNDS